MYCGWRISGLEAPVREPDARLRQNYTDWLKPHSFDPIGVHRMIHRKAAKSAKIMIHRKAAKSAKECDRPLITH